MRIIIEIMNPGPMFSGMPIEVDMDTYNTILNLIDEDSPTNQERVCKLIIKHSMDHREELADLLTQVKDYKTQMNILIPVSMGALTMVNLYKLLNVLEQGMSLFQLNKWKTEGLWYPITQYKKESDEIQVVTNLFIADQEQYHIQLSGNYPEEFDDWNNFLEENQWKIYPLLANIMQVFLPTGNYQIFYTQYPQGFISIIAKPHDK